MPRRYMGVNKAKQIIGGPTEVISKGTSSLKVLIFISKVKIWGARRSRIGYESTLVGIS